MQLIQLDIVGLSYSQTQTGAYALILGELTGNRRLPIIIGNFEAKAIAIALESEIKPARPITHDLFVSFSKEYNIKIQKIIINSIKEGVFSSIIYCINNNGKEIELDSRTSDAIAIAIRFQAPIFTYETIMQDAGILIETKTNMPQTTKKLPKKAKNKFSSLSLKELDKALKSAISEENYEQASKIRDEINKRK